MGNSSSTPSRDDCSEIDTTVYGDAAQLRQDEDALMMTTPTGELRLRSDARLHLRKELFTQGSANQNISGNSQEHLVQQTTEGSTSALDRSDLAATGKQNVNVDVAVALIQELRRTASPEELATLHKAISQRDSQDAVTQPLIRTSPIASMIRRKSTFTPGEATREAGKSPSKLQKRSPPSTRWAGNNRSGVQTWSPEMFSASPLAKLASLEGRRESPSPESRSVTPINLDKSFIGTHTLGTLRIMNGTASPEPSIRSGMGPRPLPGSSLRENEYYTASEGSGRSSPERACMHTSKSNDTFHSQTSQASQQTFPTPSDFGTIADLSREEADGSSIPPLTPRGSASTVRVHNLKHASSWHTAASSPSSPASQLYKLEAASNPFLLQQSDDDVERVESNGSNEQDILDHLRESDLTIQHAADTTKSSISKGTPDDDESVYSLAFPQPARETSPDNGTHRTLQARADLEQNEARLSPGKMARQRPKADSGYASSSSLRSLQDCSRQKNLPSVPRQAPTRYYSQQHQENSEPHQRHLQAPEIRDISYFTTDAVKSLSPGPNTEPRRQAERHVVGTRSSLIPPVQSFSSLSAPTTPEKSESLLRPGPKKLQKKNRPVSYHSYSAPLILPSSTRKGFEDVPSVPLEVASKFNDRLKRQPGMDHLEHGQSRESPRTPSPVFDVQIRFPSPSKSPERRAPQGEQRIRVSFGERVLRPNVFRRRSRTGREAYPGRRRGGPENLPPVAVADLGSVAGTLGTSPYDLATVTSGTRTRGPTSQPATHPHQMSSMRVKGLAGMSDKAASEFAQRRSRDRLANMGNLIPPRPKSFYGHASDSFEVLPSSKVRPRSFHSDQPPVPILPWEYAMHPRNQHESWRNYAQHDPVKPHYRQPRNTLMEPRPNKRNENVETAHQSDDALEQNNAEERPADWSDSARAWRMRRKSIGENLGHQAESPEDSRPKARPKSAGEDLRYQRSRGHPTIRDTPEANQQTRQNRAEALDLRKLIREPTPPPRLQRDAPSIRPPTTSDPSNILHNFTQTQTRLSLLRSPSPATTIASINSGPLSPTFSRTTSPAPRLPDIPNISPMATSSLAWEPKAGRSQSPTSSVLERAAFFDTVTKGVGRTPSPTIGGASEKRAPSPVRGPREYLVPMSKCNVNARALRAGEA